MSGISLEFLGGFRLSKGSKGEIAIPGKKAQALLAYLALNAEQRHRRDKLATLLWGDRLDEQARQSLRQSLSALRKALGDAESAVMSAQGDAVAWQGEAVEVDVHAFERLAAGETPESLKQAAALYRGTLLEGFSTNSEEFDDWLASERSRLNELACQVLERLLRHHEESGDLKPAIEAGKCLLALDSAREEAHRSLMRLYARVGRRSAALKQYQTCVKALRRELDAEPEPETTHLYDETRTRQQEPGEMGDSPTAAEPATQESLPIPAKPAIAVLPFENLSADPSQEFFADGLVEEILTSLSKISSMTVIARNSTFAYKGKAVDVRQVAQELGVRYVLEGSVRQSGDRLRISAQLIDSHDGSHVWAESYDRIVDDIFDIQDEITKEIVTALRVNLSDSERALLLGRGTNNVQAWSYCVQALEYYFNFNPGDNGRARELAEKSLKFDPEYSVACAVLGLTHWYDSRAGFSGGTREALSLAKALAEKALLLDGANLYGLGLTVFVQVSNRHFDTATTTAEKAIALNPASANARSYLGFALLHGGRSKEAISMYEDAIALNPWHPTVWKTVLARALDLVGRTAEAMEIIDAVYRQNPKLLGGVLLQAAILSREGQMAKATRAIGNLKRNHPSFRPAHLKGFLMMRDQDYVDAISEALRKAGLPE